MKLSHYLIGAASIIFFVDALFEPVLQRFSVLLLPKTLKYVSDREYVKARMPRIKVDVRSRHH